MQIMGKGCDSATARKVVADECYTLNGFHRDKSTHFFVGFAFQGFGSACTCACSIVISSNLMFATPIFNEARGRKPLNRQRWLPRPCCTGEHLLPNGRKTRLARQEVGYQRRPVSSER